MRLNTNENLTGVQLNNRYRMDALLGKGSMGEVYRAHDITLKRDVAVKVLSKGALGTSGRPRLLHEAQYIANLNHPNIVTVYDVGEHDDVPFIVMEFIEGRSLYESRLGDLETILQIAREVCSALEHAHGQGIIHRDIKPENVLLTKDGAAKLMDFGIAQSGTSRLTEQGTLLGTVYYISPEQALGKQVDPRADLYSLGILLYELVCGRLPFEADDPLAVVSQHLHAPVVPPRAVKDDLPPGLNDLIVQLMAKKPEDRPESVSEVLKVLESISTKTNYPAESITSPLVKSGSTLERIVSGRLVGRGAELNQARALWREAVGGEGQLLLLSGEPGIGKTRLVKELVTLAQISGGRPLIGRSYAEWDPPYAPIGQILRDAIRGSDGSGFEPPKALLADLVRIAPDLRADYPDLPEAPSDYAENPQQEQQRFLDQLLYFFHLLTKQGPVLLVFEDAHWSDDGTLRFLRRLSHSMRQQRLMILVTYREVELEEARALHDVLRDFSRDKLGQRIKLNRLNRQETKDMLAILFDEEITPEFLEGIYKETEGNPFFVEEVCRALVESGKLTYQDGHWKRPSMGEVGVPQSIQVAIQSRLHSLPETAQQMLNQAAVLGREFDYQTLSQAVMFDEDRLLDTLDEALRARLIEETGGGVDGGFAFVHALIPTTITAGLRTLKRRRLHKKAAEALESLHPEAFEALAHHYIEAGETDRGVDYLIKGGDRARRLFAHQEAIDSYQQAVEQLKEEGEITRAARTLMKLGQTHHNVFRFSKARQAYEEGFNLWQQAGQLVENEGHTPAPHALRGLMREPVSLDPGVNIDGFSDHVIYNIFSGLVERNPHQEVVPDVAKRWEVLDGGRRYRFYLREDVTWSDGVPVSAHDFEYAWVRALDPVTGSPVANGLYPIKNAEAYHRGEEKDPDAVGVHARGALILDVVLEKPSNVFLYIMSKGVSFPVPRHILQKHGAEWTDLDVLVTNGPFRLTTWEPGKLLILDADPTYHGSFTGNLRQVKMHFYSGQLSNQEIQQYHDDQIDYLWLGDTADLKRVQYQYPEEFRSAPLLGTYYIGFNTTLPPFDDVRVRRAFAFATDREQLVNRVFEGGLFPAAGGLLPLGMPGYSEGIAVPYNPERARSLLAEAGYPGGRNFPEVEFLCPAPRSAELQDSLQDHWLENLGIEIQWRSMAWDAFLDRNELHNPHFFTVGTYVTHPDPDELLRISFVGMKTGWSNQEYETVIQQASETLDYDWRVKLYQRADRILVEEVPFLPVGYYRFNLLVKPWVRRFPLSTTRGWFWKEVVLEPH